MTLLGLMGCVGCAHPHGEPGACKVDADCAAPELCGRDATCYPASELRPIHARWTVGGAPATATTCNPAWQLEITFLGDGISPIRFAPVPCSEGVFSIDKLPGQFVYVSLADEHLSSPSAFAAIDPTTGEAVLDL